MSEPPSSRVRIPADVDREDRLLAGLSARQLAILNTAAVLLWLGYQASRALLPLPVFAALAAPVAGGAVVLALGRRHGLPADRLLLAALAQARTPRRLVPAPEGVPQVPKWAGAPGGATPAPLARPGADLGDDGIVHLGPDGASLFCGASSVNLALRTQAEQGALIAAYTAFLNSVSEPVQILIRAEPVDLTSTISALREAAGGLPTPELEAAARGYATFLGELAARRELLRRQILVVFREPAPPGRRKTSRHAESALATKLRRRAEDAGAAMDAAGITLTPLAGQDAAGVLGRAANPHDTSGETRPAGVWSWAEPKGETPSGRTASSSVARCPLEVPSPRLSARALGLLGPESVDVHPHALRLGAGWCRTFAVVGYPREVGPGWLAPLLSHPARLEVSVHIEPVPSTLAAERLRRQFARLESARRIDAAKGRLADPEVEVAATDARDLADRMARGEGKLFRVGLYLTVHASTGDDLDDACAAVRGYVRRCCSTPCRPATARCRAGSPRFRSGWTCCGCAAPWTPPPWPPASRSPRRTCPSLPAEAALNTNSTGLVIWDRFAADNHNAVILARSGSGKSYLAKLEALRSLFAGIEVAVVDPEDEYTRLAAGVGGTVLRLGAPGVRLNPFDLPPDHADGAGGPGGVGGADALVRRALFVHTLVAVLLGEPLDPAARAALDWGILAAYAAVGISVDPRTHGRPAPLLADLARSLDADGDPAAATLAARLAPFTSGSYAGMFAGRTTTRANGHLLVFSLRELPDELKAAGTLLTLDAIWRRVANPHDRRRRLVLVDEAWLLMRDPEGARFLFRLAKAARKHWCGLTVVTQDAADLLGTDLGVAVVANAATQILLRQAPQSIDALGEAFRLSGGERAFLLSARRGEGILAAGSHRVGFRVVSSSAEHAWATTGLESDPAERMAP